MKQDAFQILQNDMSQNLGNSFDYFEFEKKYLKSSFLGLFSVELNRKNKIYFGSQLGFGCVKIHKLRIVELDEVERLGFTVDFGEVMKRTIPINRKK
jgi:hypothetical protein